MNSSKLHAKYRAKFLRHIVDSAIRDLGKKSPGELAAIRFVHSQAETDKSLNDIDRMVHGLLSTCASALLVECHHWNLDGSPSTPSTKSTSEAA